MQMKKIYMVILLSGLFFPLFANYPTIGHLWSSFKSTSGSRLHVNRVFAAPPQPMVTGKNAKRENERRKKTNARFLKRQQLRKSALDMVWSDFVPGETAAAVWEIYDLYHKCCYQAYVVTQRYLYCVTVNEAPEEGIIFCKYPLSDIQSKSLIQTGKKLKNRDGSCEMVDSKNYPSFVSINCGSGKWETVVFSAKCNAWETPHEKQAEYFESIKKVMAFISEIKLITNGRHVVPIPVKK